MAVIPDKLFVNFYEKGVGPTVGTAYESKAEADRHANTHRIACLEMISQPAGVHSGSVLVGLDEATFLSIMDIAIKKKIAAGVVIKALLQLYEAIPNDVRAKLHVYAAEHSISFGTAVAESCRAYMGDS